MRSARERWSGWVSVAAALVLATGGTLFGNSRIIAAWRFCLGEDHEPNPNLTTATVSWWSVMLVALLALGALLGRGPRSRRYRLPAMLVVAAVLTWLYITGMGTPAPLGPGQPPESVCRILPPFPFTG
ncbi:hypothetical protein [Kitasatospora aureofaciens]|uniref:hypothetical protein n=1 Tax=Kitasatospora aureofaciens TaxID=1894 RepID=UPI00131DD4CA|nr:hypothetical protein [Kitasatospora aureofaciens]